MFTFNPAFTSSILATEPTPPVLTTTATYIGTDITGSNTSTYTASFTFPAIASGNLISVHTYVQNSITLNSVVYDPSGSNISLTNNSTAVGGAPTVWTGILPAFAGGSKTIQLNYASSIQFLATGMTIFLISGQAGSSPISSFAVNAGNSTLNTTAGCVIVAGCYDSRGPDWSASTVAPSVVNNIGGSTPSAIWNNNITTTNASFLIFPKSGINPQFGETAAAYL